MINYLMSLFHDRRKEPTKASAPGERRVTVKEARAMLTKATDEFNDTITMSPDRVREMLRRAKERHD
jgi:hypothetical protein